MSLKFLIKYFIIIIATPNLPCGVLSSKSWNNRKLPHKKTLTPSNQFQIQLDFARLKKIVGFSQQSNQAHY
jgi:hypothetical protein